MEDATLVETEWDVVVIVETCAEEEDKCIVLCEIELTWPT